MADRDLADLVHFDFIMRFFEHEHLLTLDRIPDGKIVVSISVFLLMKYTHRLPVSPELNRFIKMHWSKKYFL